MEGGLLVPGPQERVSKDVAGQMGRAGFSGLTPTKQRRGVRPCPHWPSESPSPASPASPAPTHAAQPTRTALRVGVHAGTRGGKARMTSCRIYKLTLRTASFFQKFTLEQGCEVFN